MRPICVISDAHLLYQADWVDDEKVLREEANEVLDNFATAINKVESESPAAVILAGDMFDTKTQSGQRVAHREAEKYMMRIREILTELVSKTKCKIYLLRGNHDSEPVLKGLEEVLNGKLVYVRNSVVKVGEMNVALLDTHYLTGSYEIALEDVPAKADILVMHESVPLPNVSAPTLDTFVSICKRFDKVLNGHMHFYGEKVLGIENLYLLPAFIPSRDIKNQWMVKYRYKDAKFQVQRQESPFGYITLQAADFEFKRYTPLQTIVRVEIFGKSIPDYIQGLQQVYDEMSAREDKAKLRVWIKTDADKITIDRVLWEKVQSYSDIKTVDILSEKGESFRSATPEIEKELGDVAFTRQELEVRVLSELKGRDLDLARRLFDEIFTAENLQARSLSEPEKFKKLLEIFSHKQDVSPMFVQRAWELARVDNR